MLRHALAAAFAGLAWLACAPAQAAPPSPAPAAVAAPPMLRQFVSRHHGVFGGVALDYQATVGETVLPGAGGAPGASLFSFSYVRQGVRDPGSRPVIFVFNGGPGSASIWQHLGVFGPRRLEMQDAIKPRIVPPYRLQDNPDCLLDVADIVLIDPAGTGFSRLLPGGKPEDFYGVDADARATVDLIADWLTRNGRWNSPKFMVGESYGTIRAAVVAKMAAGGPTTPEGQMTGLAFNGVVLLGQAMDSTGDKDRAAAALLPSLAATAWYHGRVDRTRPVEAVVAEARAFAGGDYLRALWAGDALPRADRQAIAARLSALTGLSEADITDHDLRITPELFEARLLRGRGLEIGAYDARYTLAARTGSGDPVADDPAMTQYVPAFVGAMNDYVVHELGVKLDIPYEAISFHAVNGPWNYGDGPGHQPHVNYGLQLGAAMRRNPRLRTFIGAGYFDLVTPLGAAEYAAAHSDMPQDRVELHYYASGHMPYMGAENAAKVARDLRSFVVSASAP